MFLTLGLIVVGLCVFLHYYINRGKRNPPNLPSPYPLIGFSRFLYTPNMEDVWDRVTIAGAAATKCGGVGKITIGPFTLCAVADPEVAASILNTCFDKDYSYDFYKPWLGNGLFSGPVHIWRPNRKLILRSLNQKILDQFMGYFNSEGKRVVKNLESRCNIKEVNLHHDMALMNLRLFLRTQMGQELNEDNSRLIEYLKALEGYHVSVMKRLVNPFFHVEPLFQIFGKALQKEQKQLIETLDRLPRKVINNRKKLRKENYNNNLLNEEKEKSLNEDKIMIDLLIELNEKGVMDEKQVMNEVHTAIFGGHDTSAGTLVFALIMIGAYPEVQKKIIEELKQVLPNKDDDVTKEDLQKLVYLEAAIKESMRLYPIMGYLGRIIDRELKFENYSLYPGTRCILLTHNIARHPVWGADAEQYRPERWLPPASLPHPAAFLPFSWGKRGCIGRTYAMMSLKTTLTHILRNYKLSANHENMVIYMISTVKPRFGHELMLEKRTDY